MDDFRAEMLNDERFKVFLPLFLFRIGRNLGRMKNCILSMELQVRKLRLSNL